MGEKVGDLPYHASGRLHWRIQPSVLGEANLAK